ncbi:MAG: lactate racemase domain-containing protein [Planctomycetota bacterium]
MQFGFDSRSDWPWPPQVLLHDCCQPRGELVTDVGAATREALRNPLQFPSLDRAVVPGDRVVLAVDAGIPRGGEVVAEVLQALRAAQVPLDSITVLLSSNDRPATQEAIQAIVRQQVGEGVECVVHNPADESSLSYLAASKAGDPIYFQRHLAEADFVIPISVLRPERSPGYVGVCGGLFPNFTDQKTQERFRAGYRKKWRAHQTAWREEVSEAAWLLGVQMTLQIVPGSGDAILGVLAGELTAVREFGREWLRRAWRWDFSELTPLVVTSVEGGDEQQTWSNVAAAIASAATVVEPGGMIAVCTRLTDSPGVALQGLSIDDDERSVGRKRKQRVPDDLISATIIREMRRQRRLFLMSGLAGEVVEELGLGHVESAHELMNLVKRSERGIVVGNAHYASLHVVGE